LPSFLLIVRRTLLASVLSVLLLVGCQPAAAPEPPTRLAAGAGGGVLAAPTTSEPVAEAQAAPAPPTESTAESSIIAPNAANVFPGTAPAPLRISDTEPPAVSARYISIVDEASGAQLWEQGGDVRVAPASVTKIATTMLALKREPDLSRIIPITINGPEMAARDGSQIIGLEPGEQLSLKTLLYGMMLWSGNDAAEQVALALGDGSADRYVQMMNDMVHSLGLKNTHFVNPSGMDADGHYSSATDMAYLARFAMRDPLFREMCATQRYTAEGYPLVNINRLLGVYPGVDGVKVGYTTRAQRTMVASATRDGHRVYVSIMRSQDLVADESALLDWVWRTFSWD
jgi:D-alanyl-D-alanine carboxypeptidase